MRAVRTRAEDWAKENAIHDGTRGLVDCPHAFSDGGCAVSARPHALQGHVLFGRRNIHAPGMGDRLHYHAIDKMLFRLVKE